MSLHSTIRLVTTMKNKYAKRSRISEAKVRQIVKLFAVDLNALQIAEIAGVNRNTAHRYLAAFRERIARFCEAESPVQGEVEVDESYFGARRVKGVRGLGAKENHCVRLIQARRSRLYRNCPGLFKNHPPRDHPGPRET